MTINFQLKLLASLVIFLITLIGGLGPSLIGEKIDNKLRFFNCSEAFAGGVFFCVGLLCLLPEAQNHFQSVSNLRYPLMFLIFALTIVALRIIEIVSAQICHAVSKNYQHWIIYLLAVLLLVHSILAGLALGAGMTFVSFGLVFIAVVVHKLSAAFAFGITLKRSTIAKKIQIRLIMLFSLMTPVGIIFGSSLMSFLYGRTGILTESVFDAIAAGTFIYMATFYMAVFRKSTGMNYDHQYKLICNLAQIGCFTFGFLIMAAVAVLGFN